MSKKYNYTYITTNLINNKQYVGDHSTNNLNDGYLGSGKYFKSSIKKHGRKNFQKEILVFFESKYDAFKAQEKYIDQFKTLYPLGYNLNETGGLQCSEGWSEDLRKKIGEKRKGRIPWNKGIKYTDAQKKNLGSSKGKKLSQEHKDKISKGGKGKNIGKIRSEETKKKISDSQIGRKLSAEHKNNISKGALNSMTKEKRNNISQSCKGRIPWNKGLKLIKRKKSE